MTTIANRVDRSSLTPIHWTGIALAAVTGSIHIVLGLAAPTTPVGIASIFAGAGFGVAIWLVLVDERRRLVYALGIPYVASQIVLWYVINRPPSLAEISPAAMVDKPVQVGLIVVCVVLLVRES